MKNVQKLMLMTLISALLVTGCSQLAVPVEQMPETGLDHGSVKIIHEDQGPSQGGTLNLFMVKPDTLNPLITQNQTVRHLSSFVFDSLFYEDNEGNLKNGLVESYTLSTDGLMLDIILKDNIRFHDGQTLTSDDVAFSVQTIKDSGERSFYKDFISNIDSLKAVTRLSLRFILKKPDPGIREKLTFPIVSSHVFKDWPVEGHGDSLKLIGTGPFIFDSYKEDTVSLLRNPSWWNLTQGGLSHPIWPDGINFRVYSDESQMMDAFQKQEIDIAYIEEGNMEGYSQRSDIYFEQYESGLLEFLAFSVIGKDHSPIQVESFRTILMDYLSEYAGLTPLGIGKSSIPQTRAETNRAMTLDALAAAGYAYDEDKNVLSFYRNGGKVPVTLSLRYNGLNTDRQEVSQWLTGALFEIGIQVNPETATYAEQQALVKSGKFDMMLLGCRLPLYSDSDGALELVKESLGMSGQNHVVFPLYRKYGAVLYHSSVRGLRSPQFKNIYNGWSEWYLVKNP